MDLVPPSHTIDGLGYLVESYSPSQGWTDLADAKPPTDAWVAVTCPSTDGIGVTHCWGSDLPLLGMQWRYPKLAHSISTSRTAPSHWPCACGHRREAHYHGAFCYLTMVVPLIAPMCTCTTYRPTWPTMAQRFAEAEIP